MKKIFFATLAVIPVYLLGAFANAGFDITAWSDLGRMLISMFMAIAVVAAYASLTGMV
jgi:hypothetical protein